jgi:two-component system LytT family sensor kinase
VRVDTTAAWPRLLPRWLGIVGLLLLLSFVFASQLYWAGYVQTWSTAFTQEAMYWLSWGVLAPPIFRMCRRLHGGRHDWPKYTAGFALGALITAVLQPIIAVAIDSARVWLLWMLGLAGDPPSLPANFAITAIRVAGVNLPVYAGIVLAWHAATYYRELRDRQLRSTELESLLHQAQLQSLRSQLNPHFLFNTLHSIAELVHTNPGLAEQLILRLGKLLRQVLQSSTQQQVPLAEELDFVKGYVEIEQMRLGERLQVQWDVAPEVLQAKVPSLILQPLVENAIKHGVAPVATAGDLVIRAWRDEEFLHLQVRDSGPGLSVGTPHPRAGIGLSNTQSRLQRLYGARQSFELLNDRGLVVNVRIPLEAE